MLGDLYTACTTGEIAIRSIQRHADRTVLVSPERELTYREFGQEISQVIQVIKAMGFKKGDHMGILASNRPETLIVSTAASIMGMVYTALHPLGSEDDHAFVLEDAETDLLVVDETVFAERGKSLKSRVTTLKDALSFGASDFGTDLHGEMKKHTPQPLVAEADPGGLCRLAYTGGTTGRPKGVMLGERSLVLTILHTLAEWEWPSEIRLLAATPVSHAAGAMFAPMMVRGGTYYMLPGFDADAYLEAMEKHRITVSFLVPTMIYVLLDHPKVREKDFSAMEMMIYGAAPMSPTRLIEALDVFGQVFFQLYGQTEAPNTITALMRKDHDPARPERLASCGQPIGSNQVKVLDESNQEVPLGEIGEICLRGPLLMDGYWKRPRETAETLRGGWHHTGDMAIQDEAGYLYIVDRAKDMIISGGFNVFPREVEDSLTGHPAVSAAAVIGVPDEKWGEAVKAIVVLKPGTQATAEELMAYVKEKKGAVYAPKTVDFTDALPVTALGKSDKKQLRARYWGDSARQVN